MLAPQIKILIDGRYLRYPKTGIAKYLRSLIRALLLSDGVLNVGIILEKGCSKKEVKEFLNLKSQAHRLYFHKRKFSKNYIYHALFSHFIINKSKSDIYIHPHYDCPFFIKRNFLFVLHDFNPLVQKRYFKRLNRLKKQIFRLFVVNAMRSKYSTGVCISNNTLSDAKKFVGEYSAEKVKVIHSGVDLEFPNIDNKNIYRDFILYVGDRRRHKNLKRMVDLFASLKSAKLYTGQFIIAGDTVNDDFDLETYIKNIPDIKVIGRVSEGQLGALYKNCDALFYLSLYEGFGMPIIEASVFDKKIIASHTSSIREIAPDHALLLDLQSSNSDMLKKISGYLNEEIYINNDEYLVRFDWNHVAELYISYISKHSGS